MIENTGVPQGDKVKPKFVVGIFGMLFLFAVLLGFVIVFGHNDTSGECGSLGDLPIPFAIRNQIKEFPVKGTIKWQKEELRFIGDWSLNATFEAQPEALRKWCSTQPNAALADDGWFNFRISDEKVFCHITAEPGWKEFRAYLRNPNYGFGNK